MTQYGEHPDYGNILNYLSSKDFYYDDELPIPSFKSISLATGINDYQVKKRINQLYEDVFDFYAKPFIEFRDTEYYIYASDDKKSAQIKVKGLGTIPKIGEDVTFDLFEGRIGASSFYVKDVWHTYEQGKHIIFIILNSGRYSLFWHFRKGEAEAKRELSFNDLINMDDYELKRKLGLR
ncbi:hypothetical protein [Aestuariibaculum marinum]|uniref:Uncharacterized protein n=1 Tax=Aestuariibaculum marinum TaxID=2683592 RepID=A0A8J6PXD0_9FLAO|nr:hypothetical protein [Aestuariibaculum marinum]MBD0824452.1 hypothetical protein [Aestuariibaculum marinum]